MQFFQRVITICLVAGTLLFLSIFWRSNYEQEENPEKKILQLLTALEVQVSEYEAVVRSYRSELMAIREGNPHLSHLNQNNSELSRNARKQELPGNNIINTNRLRIGNIYNALPHIFDYDDALVPAMTIGRERLAVSLVLGIPTVKRPTQSYLHTTLENVLSSMTPAEKNDTLIIVFIAETDINFVKSTMNSLSKRFKEDVNSGLIEIVSPSPNFYPDMKTIKGTLGDSDERTRWRTKQNLDYAYLMLYAQHRGTYYVQLEDDILCKKGFVSIMKKFALQKTMEKEEWFMLDFCQLGFIGKLFRSSDLWKLVEFFLLFYQDKPGDWLLSHFFSVKYCKLDQSHKKCLKELAKHWIHSKPSLFQHIGMVSSLSGKVQKLKDRQYGTKLQLFMPHNNPIAKTESSLKQYGEKFSLSKAYLGKTYYWALSPDAGDFIKFTYDPPIFIRSYRIVTGNAEHPSDKLRNCTLEILPARDVRSEDFFTQTPDKYYVVDEFDDFGTLSGRVPETINPVSVLRLSIKSSSENWVIISEVLIEER